MIDHRYGTLLRVFVESLSALPPQMPRRPSPPATWMSGCACSGNIHKKDKSSHLCLMQSGWECCILTARHQHLFTEGCLPPAAKAGLPPLGWRKQIGGIPSLKIAWHAPPMPGDRILITSGSASPFWVGARSPDMPVKPVAPARPARVQ